MRFKLGSIGNKTFCCRKKSGIGFDELKSISDPFGTHQPSQSPGPGYEILPGDAWLEQDVDILIPAAVENQITADTVPGSSPKVKLIAEGANGPTTPEGDALLEKRGTFFIPISSAMRAASPAAISNRCRAT